MVQGGMGMAESEKIGIEEIGCDEVKDLGRKQKKGRRIKKRMKHWLMQRVIFIREGKMKEMVLVE